MENKRVKDIANLKHLRWDSLWWDSHHSEIGCPWATWEFPALVVCMPGGELGFHVHDLTHALRESNQLIPLFGLRVHIKLPIHLLDLGWIIGKNSCHPGSLFSSFGDSHDQAQRSMAGFHRSLDWPADGSVFSVKYVDYDPQHMQASCKPAPLWYSCAPLRL